MQVQYLGHAGVLIREKDIMIAFDPFLSGSFLWNGKMNTYTGNSPWIGSEKKLQSFIDTFGDKLTAIIISHAHMDHFDPITIVKLLERNPEIQFYAPYPVTDWLKASSMANPVLTQFFAPIEWEGSYEIESENPDAEGSLYVHVMPNSGIKKEDFPYRVGYLITNDEGKGLLLPGDSRATEWWDPHRSKVTHIITWGKAVRNDIVSYFEPDVKIEKMWLIHWEPFSPGNFDCNQNPQEYIGMIQQHNIPAATLEYMEWIKI